MPLSNIDFFLLQTNLTLLGIKDTQTMGLSAFQLERLKICYMSAFLPHVA